MKIKENKNEWRITFSNRTNLLRFDRKLTEKFGNIYDIMFSPADKGKDIIWIPKSANIPIDEIRRMAEEADK